MEFKQQLMADLKVAMRAKDTQTRNTIRMLQAAIKQIEIDDAKTLSNKEVEDLLQYQAKQRRDSLRIYEEQERPELAEVERFELAIIERYLPKQMSRAEIEAAAREVIAETGVDSPKGMGKVMGALLPRVKGKADGKVVSQVVRELLTS